MADSGTYTPETLARRYAMAQQLLAPNKEPIRNVWQGLNELAQGALGGYQLKHTEDLERQSRADAIAQALNAFGGGQGAPANTPPVTSAPLPAPPADASASPSGTPYGSNVVTADNGQSFPMPPRNPLAGLSPEMRTKFADLRDAAANQGATFNAPDGGLGGVRTPEQQAALYAQGRTAPGPIVTGTLNSNHIDRGQGGQALDVVPTGGATPQAIGNVVSALTKNDPRFAGMRSGATFSNLYDPLHVELNNPQGTPSQQPVQVAGPPMAPPQGGPLVPAQGGPSPAMPAPGAPAGIPPQAAPVPPQGPAPTQTAPPSAPPVQGNRAAIAAMLNPWTPASVQGALAKQISPDYGFQTLPDGTIVRTNPRTGTVEPIYQGSTKNTFGVIGENRDGQKIYGIINPEKGTATPVPVPGTPSAPGAADASGLTGEPFLQSLNDPGRADLIKGMVEGRMAPAQMGRFGTLAVQSLLKDAARYEPGFDNTKWSARVSTAKDFASGQAAKNVTSINTVIGHLGDLSQKADALGNFSIPIANQLKNFVSTQSGNPEIKNFDLARNAVADELGKVFRGSGLSDSETRQWKENINAANSPAQLKGAISTAIGLMDSRLSALNEQRNRGMSTQTEPAALLTEKSRATLEKVKKWADGDTEAAKPSEATGERKAIGGKNYFKKDGQWFEE